MANPSPQHNPTDGLNVAAYVQVTGTGITNPNGGGLTVATEHDGTSYGQGVGAVASTDHPVAQYALVLSLGGTTTCQLTPVLKDVANTTYSSQGTVIYKSYNNPDAGTPAWYSPSPFSDGTVSYDADVASVSSSGLITALAVGQAIVEVQFPVFDNTIGDDTATGNPINMIYAQIIVQVTP